jgi:vacuolar protein-sorting-associated protein 4
MDDYIKRGTKAIEDAVVADNDRDYERAFALYLQGLDWFQLAANYAPAGTSVRARIVTKMHSYIQRAEMIKEQLTADNSPQPQGVVGGGGGGGDGQQPDELRAALASAIVMEKPTIRLKDVAGLVEAKQALREAVIAPVKAPQLWGENERSWAGILLYGPPGTGKSFLAKAIAGEAECTFFSLSASDLISKWVGQSERLVKTLFAMAREKRPSIVFIDEIESILSARSGGDGGASAVANDRVVTEMLVQMDGVSHDNTGVLCLGATNLPWVIDQGNIRRRHRR